MKQVSIYTDGACSGNPGKGGWSAILQYNGKEKILSGGEPETTNNRMELLAAIRGLEALKEPCRVSLYSDSAYLVNAFSESWLEQWKRNGWQKKGGELKNIDLWQRISELAETHTVSFVKVKGHSDNEHNNRCDKLARDEIKKMTKAEQGVLPQEN